MATTASWLISTTGDEIEPGERPRRARAQAHQRLGTFLRRAVQRAAHGNLLHNRQTNDDPAASTSLYVRCSPSPRPRDEGAAAGAVTRGDIRLPQERSSEDRRKGGLTTYQYDLFGNLLRVDLPDGRAIEYDVDGAGRRVGRRELDASGNEVSFRGWIYRDLLRPIAEVDALGNVVARYVYADGEGARQNGVRWLDTRLGGNQDTSLHFAGSNVPETIELLDGAGSVVQTLVLSTNQVGSIQLVTDGASGEVVQRLEYDSFGRVAFDSNPGLQPFGFGGGIYDAETSLVRFGARDYDAVAGRWVSKDPIRLAEGFNPYLFVQADPLNIVDFLGLEGWTWKRVGHCIAAAGCGLNNQLGGSDPDCWWNTRRCEGFDDPYPIPDDYVPPPQDQPTTGTCDEPPASNYSPWPTD